MTEDELRVDELRLADLRRMVQDKGIVVTEDAVLARLDKSAGHYARKLDKVSA